MHSTLCAIHCDALCVVASALCTVVPVCYACVLCLAPKLSIVPNSELNPKCLLSALHSVTTRGQKRCWPTCAAGLCGTWVQPETQWCCWEWTNRCCVHCAALDVVSALLAGKAARAEGDGAPHNAGLHLRRGQGTCCYLLASGLVLAEAPQVVWTRPKRHRL